MTFKFFKKLTLFVIFSLLLCGCAEKRAYEDRCFIGVCGEKLSLYSDNAEVDADSLNRPYVCGFNDYVYMKISDGKTYDTINDPELYSEEKAFEGELLSESYEGEYNILRVGEKTGALTLREAWVRYNVFSEGDEFFDGAYALFDGEVTLKGYIMLSDFLAVGVTDEIAISFMPADGEWNGLPVLYMRPTDSLTDSVGFVIEGRAPRFALGLTTDYDMDLSMIPTDGRAAFVEVTLKEIDLCSGEYAQYNTAEIVSIKAR